MASHLGIELRLQGFGDPPNSSKFPSETRNFGLRINARRLPHVNFLWRTTHHYRVKLKIPDYFSKILHATLKSALMFFTIGVSKTYIWRRLLVSRQPCSGCNRVHIYLCQVVICMAERAGLEPATHGIKIRCTTFVLPLNCFGGGGWSRTNNVYLSEQIYSLPQHHRRCRPSKLFGQ